MILICVVMKAACKLRSTAVDGRFVQGDSAKLSRGKILLTVDQRSANGYESLAGRRVRSSS